MSSSPPSSSNFVKYMSLFRLNPLVMAYYLGFDVRSCFPRESELQEKYFELSSKGSDAFFAKMKKQNLARYPDAANTTDSFEHEWSDYLPSDLLPYYEDGKCYIFTPPEFKNLLLFQNNPYTHKLLSSFFFVHLLTSSMSHENTLTAKKSLEQVLENPRAAIKKPQFIESISSAGKIVNMFTDFLSPQESLPSSDTVRSLIDQFKVSFGL